MNEIIPFSELQAMAKQMARLFNKTPDDLLTLMLIAQGEGKHPAIAAQEYDVIQGRPAINSRSALSRFQTSGGKIQWHERTDRKASAEFSHPAGGTLTVEWTWERATQAKLTSKPTWSQYPAQMLASRVVAEGVRAVFPACLSGLYTVEEVQDFDPPKAPKNVTPTEPELPAFSEPETVKPTKKADEEKELGNLLREMRDILSNQPQAVKDAYRERVGKVGKDVAGIGLVLADLKAEISKGLDAVADSVFENPIDLDAARVIGKVFDADAVTKNPEVGEEGQAGLF